VQRTGESGLEFLRKHRARLPLTMTLDHSSEILICTQDNLFLSYFSVYFRSRLTQLTLVTVLVTLGQAGRAMLVRVVLRMLVREVLPTLGPVGHATHVPVVLLMLAQVAVLMTALVVHLMLARVVLRMLGPVARLMLGPVAHAMLGPVGHAILVPEADGIARPFVDDQNKKMFSQMV
jgi:hypothetical protein